MLSVSKNVVEGFLVNFFREKLFNSSLLIQWKDDDVTPSVEAM